MGYIALETLLAAKLPEVKWGPDQTAIQAVIDGASRYIDNATGRPANYYAPAGDTASERYFFGRDSHFLMLPVHVAGTVTIDGIDDAAYYESEKGWLYWHANADGEVVNSTFYDTDNGRKRWRSGIRYKVSARWGYGATPPDIVEAVSQITMWWWETQRGTIGQVAPNGFIVVRDVPPAADAILSNYIKKPFEL